MEHVDILIIGGGAAGIAAAKECRGVKVLLVDRKKSLGGVLLQCTHRGFGKNLTGMEYAGELLRDFPKEICLAMNTTVLSVTKDKVATLSGKNFGRKQVSFSQLILATGSWEIPIGALPVAGTRPAGIFTAGQMQERMNLYGFVPRGPAVILGSGDLGLIMAKQLSEAGCATTLVEQKPVCGGMVRNQHCLSEYSIKLICNTTITQVHGEPDMEGCTLSDGTYLPCKTLLIAAGLRPERSLIIGLGEQAWLHLCGNCRTVHPMIESVIQEGKLAGKTAMEHMR